MIRTGGVWQVGTIWTVTRLQFRPLIAATAGLGDACMGSGSRHLCTYAPTCGFCVLARFM